MDSTESTSEPRVKRQKTKHNQSAFERLKALKGKGSKNKLEISEIDNVYEVVNEKEYSKNVLNRQEDDWIVDDDGSGYVEDGRDIFDDDLDSESVAVASKHAENKKKKKNVSKNAGKRNIQAMLSSMPEKKKEVVNLDHDDILSDVLSEMDDNISIKPVLKRKDSEEQSARNYVKNFAVPRPMKLKMKTYMNKIEKPKLTKIELPLENNKLKETVDHVPDDIVDEELETIQGFNNETAIPGRTEQVRSGKESHLDNSDNFLINEEEWEEAEINIDTLDQVDVFNFGKLNQSNSVNSLEVSQFQSPQLDDCEHLSVYEEWAEAELKIDGCEKVLVKKETELNEEEWIELNTDEWYQEYDVCSTENRTENWDSVFDKDVTGDKNNKEFCVGSLNNINLPLINNEEEEQVFRFYWWDAFEDRTKQPGTVYLFGKTYIESLNSYASCCVTVAHIDRKIFLLPRLNVYASKIETDKKVKMVDVYHEFSNDVAEKMHLETFRTRKVTKKYAFDTDVPLQSDYLEVRYAAKYKALDEKLEGNTFSRVFGTETSFLEIFLLERKIKGPCWLEIKNPKTVTNPISWCKFETSCKITDVYIPEDKNISPPPLVVATINIRTVVGSKPKDNEIVMIGCLIHNKYHIDKQHPDPPFQKHFCVFSKPTNQVLPFDIKEALSLYKGTKVKKCDSEKALLNEFLNHFITIDPDLVMGHDLADFHLKVLCERIEKTKTCQWSRFGKLKRAIIPNKYISKDLMLGRLVCDLKVSARELIKCRSYDLETLCKIVLKLKDERPALESSDVLKMFAVSKLLLKLISLTMQDAGHITKIIYELNAMPLALQITNIAGNVMSKTLQGGRAQRNEFLLLHAFTEKNYICPDKIISGKKDQDNQNKNPSTFSRKKPTFSGGLVLDPKVGFYDKLILLMDFNSLYPSIIQEYNICFTTMQANLEPETMLLSASSEPGILPTEIRKLVESRRAVKKLMATDISNDLRIQYDIRQLALKLTANSMYGCLGFQNSRFYAKHLASLVTLKGRDILMHSRDLVQTMGYEVVYGDTDSIMINTNIIDYDQVFKIGSNIKQAVNKSYKQIELDVDGVFKYMLLLKKKKYAAVTVSKNRKGELVLQQEHKGLDIVRRDWSLLAAEVGKMVLNHILSEQSADERIDNVQTVLRKVANDLREGKVPTPLLIITKQLTKDPSQYPEKVPLSHVLVASRYNKKGGKPLGQGDAVPYVICEDGSNASATQRAYHIEELKRSDKLKIDINYYLAHQIHPVVSRLCEPIEGLDGYQIANYLGIDASSFKKSKPKQTETESEIISAPVKKFRHAKSFEFVCIDCKQLNSVTSLVNTDTPTSRLWLEKCSNAQCNVKPLEYLYSIENKLILNIKDFVEQYYDKILICEDPVCTNEINKLPLKFSGKYPICNLCNAGVMYRKISEGDLYDQISFYKFLCDTSKLDKKLVGADIEEAYQKLKESVDYFLRKSAYSFVSFATIYGKMVLKSTDTDGEIKYTYDDTDDEEEF